MCTVKCLAMSRFLYPIPCLLLTAGVSLGQHNDCYQTIFIERPTCDTQWPAAKGSTIMGHNKILKIKGLPQKKASTALLRFENDQLDAAFLKSASLRIYVASKDEQCKLSLSAYEGSISEDTLTEVDTDLMKYLGEQLLSGRPQIDYDVTEYVRKQMQRGEYLFAINSSSKKVVDLASRESGLGAELVFELCTAEPYGFALEEALLSSEGYGIKVLPAKDPRRICIHLAGVPGDGLGTLMLMNHAGQVMGQLPLSVRPADSFYHTVALSDHIPPGEYWAVFRKGRVLIKDKFELKREFETSAPSGSIH